jgi:glycosyltransferase involved in cell wall biosynthesis
MELAAVRERRIKILFLLPSIGGGGAEINIVRIANHLDRFRYQPIIAVGRGSGAFEKRLDQDIQIEVLCEGSLWSSTGRLARSLPAFRHLLRRATPHLVCAGLEHTALLASAALVGVQDRPAYVACIQNSIGAMSHFSRFVLRCALSQADRVIALSAGVAREITEWSTLIAGRLQVIANAAVDDAAVRLSREPLASPRPHGPLLVACGRLTRQKGFDLLLAACASLPSDSWSQLWIIGEGPERDRLIQLGNRLNLTDRVSFLGFRSNPYSYFAAADIFVLSSRWEGFANVIVEAMACGCPVVAFDCPHGPAEILDKGRFGVLVAPDDPRALARALFELLGNAQYLRHLREIGPARASKFTAQHAAEQYACCFERLITERPPRGGL